MEPQYTRYTTPQLFLAGLVSGVKLDIPAKWVRRHHEVRGAVAWCVFWAGVAFFVSLAVAEAVVAWWPTLNKATVRVCLMYACNMVLQSICSSPHRLIAASLQQKSQHAASLPNTHTTPPANPSNTPTHHHHHHQQRTLLTAAQRAQTTRWA